MLTKFKISESPIKKPALKPWAATSPNMWVMRTGPETACLKSTPLNKRPKLLNPYAPHLAEELWQKMGNDESIAYSHWPMFVEKFCVDQTCTVVVQVNGKLRGKFEVEAGTSKEELERLALSNEGAIRNIEGKEIKKIITVPDKLVNIVVQ